MGKRGVFLFILLLSLVVVFGSSPPAFNDPGVTPSSLLYHLDIFVEKVESFLAINPYDKARLQFEFSAERFAEASSLLSIGNYKKAEVALSFAQENYLAAHYALLQLPAAQGDLSVLNEITSSTFAHDSALQALLTQYPELSSSTIRLQQELVRTELAVEQKKTNLAAALSQDKGLSLIEAQMQMAEQQELSPAYRESIVTGLSQLESTLSELKLNAAPDVQPIIQEIFIELLASKNALQQEREEDAYQQLKTAELLSLQVHDARRTPTMDALSTIASELEEQQIQSLQEKKDFVHTFTAVRDHLAEKYPPLISRYEQKYETEAEAIHVAEEISRLFPQKLVQLEKEGYDASAASKILSEKIISEYSRVYGQPYYPPGVAEQHIGAGFILDYTYKDPLYHYSFIFSPEGYHYTTDFGITHRVNLPLDGATAYATGNEMYTYSRNTKEGAVEFSYFPTGYEITLAGATIEKQAYPFGEHALPGQKMLDLAPTGFTISSEKGRLTQFSYDPEYTTFISPRGDLFTPPAGIFAGDRVEFNSVENTYSLSLHGGAWAYHPASGTWATPAGTYIPAAKAVAPLGHEEEQAFTTAAGEVWAYDTAVARWKSSTGVEFNVHTGEYLSASGKTYMYDLSSKTFLDSSGHSWSYDTPTQTWRSSLGESYTAGTHFDPGSSKFSSRSGGGSSGGGGGDSSGSSSGDSSAIQVLSVGTYKMYNSSQGTCNCGPATTAVNNESNTTTYCRCMMINCSAYNIAEVNVTLKITEPTNNTVNGTVVLGTGGGGTAFYEGSFGVNATNTTVIGLVHAGYRVIQRAWFGTNGWMQGPGGGNLSCRYGTLIYAINQSIHNASSRTPFCVSGNSGGAAEISYALARYGIDRIVDLAVITSGPPLGRLDYGCGVVNSTWLPICQDEVGLSNLCVYTPTASALAIDGLYSADLVLPSGDCANSNTSKTAIFYNDSVVSPNILGEYNQTQVRFIFGTADGSEAQPLGKEYLKNITSFKSNISVAADHILPNKLPGAKQIYDDIMSNCSFRH